MGNRYRFNTPTFPKGLLKNVVIVFENISWLENEKSLSFGEREHHISPSQLESCFRKSLFSLSHFPLQTIYSKTCFIRSANQNQGQTGQETFN